MPPIAGANAAFPLRLAAAIGIERPDWILLDVRCALFSIEHVVGRKMDQRDSTLPGFHRNPGGRLSVDGKSQRFVGLGAVDIRIGGRIDDDVPWPDAISRATASPSVKSRSTWPGATRSAPPIRNRADLLPDLASSAKKKSAHSSCTLRRQAAAAGASCFANSGCHQARLSMYHCTVARSPDSNVCRGRQPSSVFNFAQSIA